VLSGGVGLAALRRFQRTLGAEMHATGIGSYVRSNFKPHLTLLYADTFVAGEAIAPLQWRVEELLLIDSHVGEGVHEVRGRWPLAQRQGVLVG
jgi:2'-5' RNA ligase